MDEGQNQSFDFWSTSGQGYTNTLPYPLDPGSKKREPLNTGNNNVSDNTSEKPYLSIHHIGICSHIERRDMNCCWGP